MDMTLPEICAHRNLEDGAAIFIKRGEAGYYKPENRIDPNAYNELRHITPEQREAMYVGSLFGWDVPGAYAANYLNRNVPKTV